MIIERKYLHKLSNLLEEEIFHVTRFRKVFCCSLVAHRHQDWDPTNAKNLAIYARFTVRCEVSCSTT